MNNEDKINKLVADVRALIANDCPEIDYYLQMILPTDNGGLISHSGTECPCCASEILIEYIEFQGLTHAEEDKLKVH